MKLRPGFVAGLIVLVAGTAYVLWQSGERSGVDPTTRAPRRLVDVKNEDVTALEVERRGALVRVERVEQGRGGWRVARPDTGRSADARTVQQILSLLSRSERVQTVRENADDLAPYGLGGEGIEFRVTARDGREFQVEVGSKPPTEKGVYARVGATRDVIVADDDLEALTAVDPNALLERAFLPGAAEAVRLEIVRPEGRIVLERAPARGTVVPAEGGGGESTGSRSQAWVLVEPFRFPADDRRVRAALAALEELRVEPAPGLLAAQTPPEAISLDSPTLVVSARLEGAGERSLLVGNPYSDEFRWVRRGGEERLSFARSEQLEVFSVDPARWHARKAASVDRYRARSLTVKIDGEVKTFSRDETGWSDGAGRSVPETAVLTLVASLFEARGSAVDATPRRGAPEPLLFARLEEVGGTSHVIEAWGPDASGRWRVRPEPFDAALVVSGATMEQFVDRLESLSGPR